MKRFIVSVAMVLSLVFIPTFANAQVAPNSTCISLTRNLTVGSTGQDVKQLQIFLAGKGFLTSQPTGYFGFGTRKAVSKWQVSVGLSPASGYVGALTRSMIKSVSCSGATADVKPMALNAITPFVSTSTGSVSVTNTNASKGPCTGDNGSSVCLRDVITMSFTIVNPTNLDIFVPKTPSLALSTISNPFTASSSLTSINIAASPLDNQNVFGVPAGSLRNFVYTGVMSANPLSAFQTFKINSIYYASSTVNYNSGLMQIQTGLEGLFVSQTLGNGGTGTTTLPTSADVNKDGVVNSADINFMNTFIGTTAGTPDFKPSLDFNGDGKIDATDAALFQVIYNQATQPTKSADLNKDGLVDYRDLQIFSDAVKNGYNKADFDLNSDGKIDYKDLVILRAAYNAANPSLVGDLTGDRFVDYHDLSYFNDGYRYASQNKVYVPLFDLNSDGVIDYKDTKVLRDSYNAANPSLVGDLTGDQFVDYHDLSYFNDGYKYAISQNMYIPIFDLNSDGVIDYNDVAVLRNGYNKANPSLIADLTGDRLVDYHDLSYFNDGYKYAISQSIYIPILDLNSDGRIDNLDLAIVQTEINKTTTKTADVNSDGKINSSDIAFMNTFIGTVVGDPDYKVALDFNNDGKVDSTDAALFQAAYNAATQTGTASSTPAVKGASTECAALTQALQKGTTDSYSNGEVTLLQKFLGTQGYPFSDFGTFGPMTDTALKQWQAKQGISATGVTGPLTRAAIETISCK